MSPKYETAKFITISAAMYLYKCGTCMIVTDGKYVQVEKEMEEKK